MTAVEAPATVTKPGVFTLTDADYFADPVPAGSLSHSGAKVLLAPGCPALFHYQQSHGRPDKAVFDFGRAAHRLVLGDGADIAVIPDELLSSNGAVSTTRAKEFVAKARAEGKTPLVSSDAQTVDDMAEALTNNPLAMGLLSRPGVSEAALFALDTRDDVWLRGKIDRLPDADGRRLLVTDYKTAPTADPDQFTRAVWNYRYFSQSAWYIDLIRALDIADDIAFMFIVQAKEPPYLSFVADLEPAAIRAGRARNREAIALYADCRRRDVWPGPSDDDVIHIALPAWATRDED